MADWIRREHSKADIDRAGARVTEYFRGDVNWVDSPPDVDREFSIVQNWRSSHAMPLLTVRMNLSQRAKRIDSKALVAQRIKRFISTVNKLHREPTMKLSQMQDLGGCRAILSNVQNLRALYEVYTTRSLLSQEEMKCYDYLNNPKADGYRGIHLVVRYVAREPKNEPWNGQRIEIQLRTKLQHAFATAVETVTTFTKSPLKSGGGSSDWRRFFSLVGSAFAVQEGTALVPGTPIDYVELLTELRSASAALNVERRLKGWTTALRVFEATERSGNFGDRWVLLILDLSKNTMQALPYVKKAEAAKKLNELEKLSNPDLDAVLVWVNQVKDLRKAFPNYYADTTVFVESLVAILGSKIGSVR